MAGRTKRVVFTASLIICQGMPRDNKLRRAAPNSDLPGLDRLSARNSRAAMGRDIDQPRLESVPRISVRAAPALTALGQDALRKAVCAALKRLLRDIVLHRAVCPPSKAVCAAFSWPFHV